MRKNKADVDKPRGCETALSFDDLMSQQIATVSGPRKGESLAPGGVRGFQDGQFGEGGGLAVRLMSGQRMAAR